MIKNSIVVTLLLGSPLIADMSFEMWQQQEREAFINYQTQMDKEFIKMLKNEWQEYRSKQVLVPYQPPKPQQQPILQPLPKPQEYITPIPTLPKIEPLPTLSKKQEITGFTKLEFDFFGIDIEIHHNRELEYNIENVSTSTIANFWTRQSSRNYQSLIKEIQEYQKTYKLDGWATYLLIKEITNRGSYNTNSQNLMQWFILVKLGVDAKIGFAHNSLSLLVYSQEKLYDLRFFEIDGKKYYNLNNRNSIRLQIYRENMRDLYELKFLDQQITLPYNINHKKIEFVYQDRAYLFNIPYNRNLISLYKSYPQLAYYKYKNISSLSWNSIHQQLSPIISKMNKAEAINFLLRLTQNGFEYKTDKENFGKEKVMFFEETLHYDYSDCEDRAIFFAILVRELLKLNIIFVKYPNHLATAIKLNSNLGGDTLIYQNQTYTIADPTYSSANIGQAMPQLKGQKIKIIEPRR